MRRAHEVNFFVKLLLASLIMVAAWLAPSWIIGWAIALAVVALLGATRVPGLRGYLKGGLLLVALVMGTWTVNLTLQGLPLDAALATAARMAARLIATTGAFFFVMETSTPGSILAACSAARLPSMATLVLSLVFGVIPMLREEFERIGDAQRARGMEIDGVPLPTRLRFALARGVPLLVQAVRMAHAISISLAIYGYDTRHKRSTWRHVGLMVEARLPLPERSP